MEHAQTSSDWLIMLYLAGDNDLFRFAEMLIEECSRVGSTRRVKVVAEHDPVNPRQQTFRGVFENGTWQKKPIGRTAGTPADVVAFIQSAKSEFPAEQRVLVFFDHGNGWQNVHVFEPVQDAHASLQLKNIRQILTDEGTDVLCFDSCLMAMIEIVYELKDRVKFIVASENVIPADTGWPYQSILGDLKARPTVTPRDVAVAIVNGFGGSYNGSDQPVTLTAINVAAVDDAVTAIDALARELIAECTRNGSDTVALARRYAQSFGNPDYIDIVSFCEELERLMHESKVARRARYVRHTLEPIVMAFTRSGAPSIEGAHGLSIYYPNRPVSDQYDQLDFAKPERCMWSSFIRMMAPPLASAIELTDDDLRRERKEKKNRLLREAADIDDTSDDPAAA